MHKLLIHDVTLRDGSHAVGHKLTAAQVRAYAAAADKAGVPIIEVGHGNGLGASSLQVGESFLPDMEMLKVARENISRSKLGIFIIPGFATINKDLKPAIEAGADVVRVASHCTEADITERHISYAREKGKEVYGVLMMTHMAPGETLAEEALKMESYGAQGVILMDSAGAYLQKDVTEKVSALVKALTIPVGFHAHNNLGLSVANSVAAAEAGATIIDGSARGFGAGAGNTPIELLIGVFEKMGFATGVQLYQILDASDIAEKELMKVLPYPKPVSIVSGLAGVFAGFAKHVERVAAEYKVDPRDIFFELGRRRVVGGQEDLIVEVAIELSGKKEPK
jgi:4-hydroxy 2-oxovalerate aldolase